MILITDKMDILPQYHTVIFKGVAAKSFQDIWVVIELFELSIRSLPDPFYIVHMYRHMHRAYDPAFNLETRVFNRTLGNHYPTSKYSWISCVNHGDQVRIISTKNTNENYYLNLIHKTLTILDFKFKLFANEGSG